MEEIEAEPERAAYAFEAATAMLASAMELAEQCSFDEAILSARDSMRMASSALLFKDGLVAGDLESICAYLKKKYGDELPVEEWRDVERLSKTSIVDRIADMLTRSRGRLEQNANRSTESARRFLSASSTLLLS